jgi:hypothetical protein
MKLLLTLALLVVTCALAADPPEDLERIVSNPPATGLLFTVVVEGGQAAEAGFREGDILIAYAGQPAGDQQTLAALIQANAAQERVAVHYWRGGAEKTGAVKGGRLSAAFVPLEKGKPLARLPESAYEPNFAALKTGESFYDFIQNGRKIGFERYLLTASADGAFQVDRLTRFKGSPEFQAALRTRLGLARDRHLSVNSLRFEVGDQGVANVNRSADMLLGIVGKEQVKLPVAADAVPSSALDLVALTMPRKLGARVRFTMLAEGGLKQDRLYELSCAARERIRVGEQEVEAFRYESTRFGVVSNRYWIADDRLVRTDYNGPHSELTDRETALKGLPAGVDTNLE